jgi:citrate lyase subunit alpha/citrate CoA-transferase
VNPGRPESAERLAAAGLKIVALHGLAAKARSIIGEPDALPFGDKVVGIVMDRHGKVLDEIHNIVD